MLNGSSLLRSCCQSILEIDEEQVKRFLNSTHCLQIIRRILMLPVQEDPRQKLFFGAFHFSYDICDRREHANTLPFVSLKILFVSLTITNILHSLGKVGDC